MSLLPCISVTALVVACACSPLASVADITGFKAASTLSNLSKLTGVIFSPWIATSPLSVVTITRPRASSATDRTSFPGSPCAVVNVVTTPFFIPANPELVPIQSAPSLVASKQRMSALGSTGVEVVSKTENVYPSKRTRPASVASHRNPSLVCASACTVFCGRPFSITQDWRPNSANGVVGSRAKAATERNDSRTATQKLNERNACARLVRPGLEIELEWAWAKVADDCSPVGVSKVHCCAPQQ